eukprot:c12793_g2_i2.p1 GENE.c12793_g2_i2~~c12793_g2_i2.p1  ORF type:complete len:483 (+),score=212.90 c12793_g2_i2:71-1450(+)
MTEELKYLWGFGGYFQSEALPNAVPVGQRNPQRCPYDLYCEKLSGTAFTAPRTKNLQTWLYRIQPSVKHIPYEPVPNLNPSLISDFDDKSKAKVDPNQMRWMPVDFPTKPTNFVTGLVTVGGNGSPGTYSGFAVHLYSINESMKNTSMMNSDGDFLIVPQVGVLRIQTEFGIIRVEPREICVIQRGMHFSVNIEGPSRGYVLECFARHFVLPELGPIGSHGLANPQDFCSPVAHYEDVEVDFVIVNKFCGELFQATQKNSPYNVVGWAGNYVPYKYDLRRFLCINSVTYDHPDPSIYTVLTCPSDEPGFAVADFVIFPPRWMPQEHTFRPPWYHRNCMAEFMGMIWGEYDAKTVDPNSPQAKAFVPGGASLHNWMTAHGPDNGAFEKGSTAVLQPHYFNSGLAFMFESKFVMKLTKFALEGPHRDHEYYKCWQQLPKRFSQWTPGNADHMQAWKDEKTK